MANNLLDTIRGNTTGAATQQQGQEDTTQSLQSLLRAKSGRQFGSDSGLSSSLGEQAAVQQTNTTMQNAVLPKAQVQNEMQQQQQNEQTQSNNVIQAETAQSRRGNVQQEQLKTNELLSSLEQGRGRMDAAQYKAGLDQVAQNLRLQNKQYIDTLQREGQKSRLLDDAGFQEAYYTSVFDNKSQLMQIGRTNKTIYNQSDREFQKSLGDMDINYARALFSQQIAGEQQRALYGSIGSGVSAGVGAYGSAAESSDKKDYYTNGGGSKDQSYDAYKARK